MSDTTELTVLKHLAMRRRIQFVAAACGIYPKDVKAIADRHGALREDGEIDFVAAGHAAEVLDGTATGAIPKRAPAPVHTQPAAATEPVRPRQHPTPAAGDDQLQRVPLDEVHPDPDNPRSEVGDVTELAESLRVVGLLQPIVARRTAGGKLVIVAGHRRHAAARLAGWTSVQVIVRREMRPDDVLAAMLVENSHRKDLDPIEEARGLARLKAQLGGSDAAVARRVGRVGAHVTARLLLLALPIEEQEEVRRGEMTLVEAKDRAKLASGRGLGTGLARGMPHLSSAHALAERVRARCRRLNHPRGKGQGVGGVGCGACWEVVIRADERQHLQAHSARVGTCVVCDAPVEAIPTTPLREATA